MTESGFIAYFENLAKVHKLIAHSELNRAFYYIEGLDELSEFDEALRSMTSNVTFLLVASKGELDDSGSENHVDALVSQVYILKRKGASTSLRDIFAFTKSRLIEIVGRVKNDFRYKFTFSDIPYQKVGPMFDEWYGYTAMLPFSCPFSVEVKPEIWSDKE